MNGYKMTEESVSSGATFLPPSNIGDLPDTVDWRTKGYVTPVKNQVSGRCTSHPSKPGQWEVHVTPVKNQVNASYPLKN